MSMLIRITISAAIIAALFAISPAAAAGRPVVLEAVRNYASNIPADLFQMRPDVFLAKWKRGEEIFVLDVRRPDEYAAGHLEKAVNIPVHEIADHLDLLPEDPATVILVYCRSGTRSMFATSALLVMGYKTVHAMPVATAHGLGPAIP